MKKSLIMLLIMFFAVTANCYAEITKSAGQGTVGMNSNYMFDDKLSLHISLNRSAIFGAFAKSEYYDLMLNNVDSKNGITLNAKNPPMIEIKIAGVFQKFELKKITSIIIDQMINFDINKKNRNDILQAEGIKVTFYTKTESKTYELPKEIVAEWKEILQASMRDEYRAITGK